MKYAKNGLRKRQSSRFKRIITKNMSVITIYQMLAPIYNNKVKAPYCLIDFTVVDYNRLRNNIIDLKGMTMYSGGVGV